MCATTHSDSYRDFVKATSRELNCPPDDEYAALATRDELEAEYGLEDYPKPEKDTLDKRKSSGEGG